MSCAKCEYDQMPLMIPDKEFLSERMLKKQNQVNIIE